MDDNDEQPRTTARRQQRAAKAAASEAKATASSSSGNSGGWGSFTGMWETVSNISANLADRVLDALDDMEDRNAPSLDQELREADGSPHEPVSGFASLSQAAQRLAETTGASEIFAKGTDTLGSIGTATFHLLAREMLGRRQRTGSTSDSRPQQGGATSETETQEPSSATSSSSSSQQGPTSSDASASQVATASSAPTDTEADDTHLSFRTVDTCMRERVGDAHMQRLVSVVEDMRKELDEAEQSSAHLYKECLDRLDSILPEHAQSSASTTGTPSTTPTRDDDASPRDKNLDSLLRAVDQLKRGVATEMRTSRQDVVMLMEMSKDMLDEIEAGGQDIEGAEQGSAVAAEMSELFTDRMGALLAQLVEAVSEVILERDDDDDIDIDEVYEQVEAMAHALDGLDDELVYLRHDAMQFVRRATGMAGAGADESTSDGEEANDETDPADEVESAEQDIGEHLLLRLEQEGSAASGIVGFVRGLCRTFGHRQLFVVRQRHESDDS